MGNSGKDEVGIVDCGVGSIVWVRRRNGSWWPGKILGPEELSTAHLVSPRSGTPVKLLGREDASVDWYNLEKSKRVKPFRCCEFDECIEKAEAALGLPPKKREKYARREDAILHALELEKQLLDDKSGNFGPPIKGFGNKSSNELKKESEIYSEGSDYENIGKNVNLKHGSKKFVVSTEDEDVNDCLCPPEVNGVSQTGEDVNISTLLPCASGSQGLGLRSSRAKQKLSSTSLNGSGKLELDNFDHDIPISDLIYESSVIPGIKSSVEKKRQSAHDALPNESLAKRRDRRRALVQVLQKSEKLPSKSSLQLSEEDNIEPKNHANMSGVLLPNESNDCDDDDQLAIPNQLAKSPSHMEVDNFSRPTKLDEDSASESTESTETDSSKTHSMNTDEDGIAEPALIPEVEPKSLEISGQVRHGSTSRMMLDDNDMSHLYSHDLVPASLGVSKWQSKGKRNNRSLSKRSTKATDLWVARGSMYTANHEEVESDGFEENDVIERNLKTQKGPYYNQGYTSNPKTSFKGYDVSRNIIDWDNLAWNEQPLMRGYWEGPSNHFGPKLGGHQFGGKMKSVLEDVDLKVQTSYQREHVPMISLMSKLNGKAIVGHPIQVQILEYGSTDSLLEKLDNDATVHVPWTTARRSANFRVQCPQPSTIMEGEANIGNFRHVNHKKTPFMKSSVTRKGISHGKSPKKSPKKGLSSSQKTRNLSAIGREQRFGRSFGSENKNSFRVGGLIKGNAGMATVACIPLKLVFSRLNEELVDRHNKT